MKDIIKHRINWIDSLRGISALLVAFTHVTGLILEKDHVQSNMVYYSWMLGRIGVIIFFMISGFVIPYSLYNKSIKQFVISRFFRLYPAYWLSIIAVIAVSGFVTLRELLTNITMFQKLFGSEDLIGVYWTLQIELFFYFICAALFYFGYLYKDKIIAYFYYLMLIVATGIAIERFHTDKKLPVAFPLSLSVMFLGFLYRNYYYNKDAEHLNKIKKQIGIFLITIIPVAFLAYNKDYGFNEKWWQYLFSYVIAIAVFLIYSRYNRTNTILLFFGNISFSLYLFHQVVIMLMEKMNLYNSLSHTIYVTVFLLVSISVSTVSYYLVEKPFISLGKRIIKSQQTLASNV
jgi:peptidoglycan/LPS O-acetylase OafA/YrhL